MSINFRARLYHKERITSSNHRKFYVYRETHNNNQLNDHSIWNQTPSAVPYGEKTRN